MRKLTTLVCSTLALLLLSAPMARAQSGNACNVSQELDRYRLLRRLTLDLKNTLPAYEEYMALDGESAVPEARLDALLASDEFRIAMRRFHEKLLWPNVSDVAIADVSTILGANKQTGIYSIIGAGRRKAFRKGTGNETCADFEHTDYDTDGAPIAEWVKGPTGVDYLQDGWIWVKPYWDPNYPIKVCAFDAQTAEMGNKGACDTSRGKNDQKCGCGPSLRHCFGGTGGPYSGQGVPRQVLNALREQLLRLVDDHTVGGRPYSELLTTKRTYMNGVLYHWKKYLANMVGLNRTFNHQDAGDPTMPEDPQFTDATWESVERSQIHAGLQTLPAFTLRFQTNRGRANRFRTVFTKQYFVPPADPTDTGCDPNAEDLMEKCTCRKCHQVLEPLAAHFGLISEAGSTLLSDTKEFPIYNAKCDPSVTPKVPFICNRFYVVDKQSYNPGTLLPYQFANIDDALHSTIEQNLAGGPVGWAQTIINSGQFQSAMVRHVFEHFTGRDMILDPTRDDNEIELLTQLSNQLQKDDDFRALVKTIVQLPQYRRVR